MLECLQLQEYEQAREYIRRLRNHETSCLKKSEENLKFDLKWADSQKEKEQSKFAFEEYAKRCRETLDLCDLWERMITDEEYDRIHSMIELRIEHADEFCREKFGEFYE